MPDVHFRKGVVPTVIFVLSSQILPFVAEDRLRALPLEVTFAPCFSVIDFDLGSRCS